MLAEAVSRFSCRILGLSGVFRWVCPELRGPLGKFAGEDRGNLLWCLCFGQIWTLSWGGLYGFLTLFAGFLRRAGVEVSVNRCSLAQNGL